MLECPPRRANPAGASALLLDMHPARLHACCLVEPLPSQQPQQRPRVAGVICGELLLCAARHSQAKQARWQHALICCHAAAKHALVR